MSDRVVTTTDSIAYATITPTPPKENPPPESHQNHTRIEAVEVEGQRKKLTIPEDLLRELATLKSDGKLSNQQAVERIREAGFGTYDPTTISKKLKPYLA